MEESKGKFTPGVKQCADEEVADGVPQPEDQAQEEIRQFLHQLIEPSTSVRKPKVRFDHQN